MDDAFLVVFLRALRGEDLHQIEAKGKTKAPESNGAPSPLTIGARVRSIPV
jgi:hypothetical protein